MAGIWKVERKPEATVVSYFDRDTRKGWPCGEAPPYVTLTNTLSWIAGQISMADVIEVDGYPFVCDFGQHIFNPLLH